MSGWRLARSGWDRAALPRDAGAHAGFSLAELVVAMAVLSLGVLVLVSAAAFAQRSFADAEALDRAAQAAALVLDSLVRERAPVDGERTIERTVVRWTAVPAAGVTVIRADVEFGSGGRMHRIIFHARRADVPDW